MEYTKESVIEKYMNEEEERLLKPQESCDHSDFYRYWLDKNHLINVCRICFHEWEEKNPPFQFSEYFKNTFGKQEQTSEDIMNRQAFQMQLKRAREKQYLY